MTPAETIQHFLDEIKAHDEITTKGPWFVCFSRTALPKAGEVIGAVIEALNDWVDFGCESSDAFKLRKRVVEIIEGK